MLGSLYPFGLVSLIWDLQPPQLYYLSLTSSCSFILFKDNAVSYRSSQKVLSGQFDSQFSIMCYGTGLECLILIFLISRACFLKCCLPHYQIHVQIAYIFSVASNFRHFPGNTWQTSPGATGKGSFGGPLRLANAVACAYTHQNAAYYPPGQPSKDRHQHCTSTERDIERQPWGFHQDFVRKPFGKNVGGDGGRWTH